MALSINPENGCFQVRLKHHWYSLKLQTDSQSIGDPAVIRNAIVPDHFKRRAFGAVRFWDAWRDHFERYFTPTLYRLSPLHDPDSKLLLVYLTVSPSGEHQLEAADLNASEPRHRLPRIENAEDMLLSQGELRSRGSDGVNHSAWEHMPSEQKHGLVAPLWIRCLEVITRCHLHRKDGDDYWAPGQTKNIAFAHDHSGKVFDVQDLVNGLLAGVMGLPKLDVDEDGGCPVGSPGVPEDGFSHVIKKGAPVDLTGDVFETLASLERSIFQWNSGDVYVGHPCAVCDYILLPDQEVLLRLTVLHSSCTSIIAQAQYRLAAASVSLGPGEHVYVDPCDFARAKDLVEYSVNLRAVMVRTAGGMLFVHVPFIRVPIDVERCRRNEVWTAER